MPEFGSACRIRFGPSVDRPVAMVREWFAARGRERFVWLVGPSTTPTDLDRRLLELGVGPNPGGSDMVAMVVDHVPPPSPVDIEFRRVETFADYTAMWHVMFEGFGMPEDERNAVRATLRERWAATADDPAAGVSLPPQTECRSPRVRCAIRSTGRCGSRVASRCRRSGDAASTGLSFAPAGTTPYGSGLVRSS
jgi:hypothetical protein